jgi:hypothetical protein
MPEMCLQNAPRGPPAAESARGVSPLGERARARLRASEGALTDDAPAVRWSAGAPERKALWEARQRPIGSVGYPRPSKPTTPAYGPLRGSNGHSRGLQRLAKRWHAFEQRGGQVSAVERRRRVQERLRHVRFKLLAGTVQEHRGPSPIPLRQSEDGAQRDILGRIGGRDKRVVRGGQKRLLRHGRHRPGPKERTSPRDSTGDAPVKRTLPYARGHWRTLARERTRVRRFTFLMIHVFRASRLRWRRGGAAARRAIHVFGDSRFSRPLGDSRFSGFTFFAIHVLRLSLALSGERLSECNTF